MYSKQEKKQLLKATTTQQDLVRKAGEQQLTIRKQKKEEMLAKRRRETVGGVPAVHDPTIIQKLQQLPQLVAKLQSTVPLHQLEATIDFRKLLSMERNPPIDEVIAAGVVPVLVNYLGRYDNAELQFEAAWALTNIASGTSEHTQLIRKSGAVPLFIQLLGSTSDDVKEQAIWAIGNIAGDSAECRNFVLQLGVLPPLIQIIANNPKLPILRNATWTLSNLCRGKPIPEFNLVAPALPVLAHLLYNADEEVLTDACWAISYLSDGPNDRIEAVVQAQVVRRLCELLLHPQPSVQTPALRTIGNIVTGNDSQTQAVINCGALQCLKQLLTHPKKSIKKEACWTISNITAGNKDQIKVIIDAGLVLPLINLLSSAEYDVRKEAAWALSNATSGGTDEQIAFLVKQGCIKPLCEMLSAKEPKVISVALEALQNILESGARIATDTDGINKYAEFVEAAEGLSKLDKLQWHKHPDIYEKSRDILDTFFEVEDEDEDLAPEEQNDAFVFGSNVQMPTGGFNFQNN